MHTLGKVGLGLGRAWDALAEGWNALHERAGGALTLFSPRSDARAHPQVQTPAEQAAHAGARWALLAGEVRDQDDTISVSLEIPGMEPDDFDISVRGDQLIVRGEKHARRENRSSRLYIMECAYGQFERMVPLPASVTEQGAQAHYRQGVLNITLVKSPSARRRHITVTTGNNT